MFFTMDILESLILIGVITLGIVWYSVVLARREERERADTRRAA
jgi:hypothetical protein